MGGVGRVSLSLYTSTSIVQCRMLHQRYLYRSSPRLSKAYLEAVVAIRLGHRSEPLYLLPTGLLHAGYVSSKRLHSEIILCKKLAPIQECSVY